MWTTQYCIDGIATASVCKPLLQHVKLLQVCYMAVSHVHFAAPPFAYLNQMPVDYPTELELVCNAIPLLTFAGQLSSTDSFLCGTSPSLHILLFALIS